MVTIFGLNKRVVNDLRVLYDNKIFDSIEPVSDASCDVVLCRLSVLTYSVGWDSVKLVYEGVESFIEINDLHYVAIG